MPGSGERKRGSEPVRRIVRSSPPTSSHGALTLVATPIGNLGDITLRALDALRAADVVASEDTRKTGLLLRHFEISKPQISFREQNEQRAGPRLISLLQQGRNVALVTDAGTPGIADPGFTLVRAAIQNGIPCTMAPGPSALIMALALSGLAMHSFTFKGFPPRRPGPRRRFLAQDAESPHTLVFYESPHRLSGFLKAGIEALGDRPAALANDLTKVFETMVRGPLSQLLEWAEQRELKGEFVVVVGGASDQEP